MGEEKKEEEKKEEEKKVEESEKKEEEKKEEEVVPEEIVLKVDMHCEACARKVERALRGFQGVEDVKADCKAHMVVVKGKTADPIKVCERIQRKSGRKVEIISPLPKPPEEEKKADDQPTQDNKDNTKQQQEEEKKADEPPPVITVILNVRMHCEACAQVLQKRIRKIQGVESVETNLTNSQVIVKGVIDPAKLVESVYKKTRKQVSIVINEEEKKEEEKKEEEKKEEEKKKEEEEEKKKKEGGNEGGGKDSTEDDTKSEIKKSEYWHPKYYTTEYHAYPPQMFSDENPNACSVM